MGVDERCYISLLVVQSSQGLRNFANLRAQIASLGHRGARCALGGAIEGREGVH